MFGVGFCFLAVMYVLSTDVVVERNEKRSDDVRYGPPLKLLVLTFTWSLALQLPVRHAQ